MCAHGDCHAYPQAEVTVIINDQTYLLTVGVVNGLSFDVILGTDLPVLFQLLQEEKPDLDVCMNDSMVCPVVTQSQAKVGIEPLPDHDDSLRECYTKGLRKSRRQRHFEKKNNVDWIRCKRVKYK